MMYALVAEKSVSHHEIGESSSAPIVAEEFQSADMPFRENTDRILYTCQIPDSFGILKCSTVSAEGFSEDYIPDLHVLLPSAKPFRFLTRLEDFPRLPLWFQLLKTYQDLWAIAPYLQPVPLSQILLSIEPAVSDDCDSEDGSTNSKFGFDNSDSDNMLNNVVEYDLRRVDQLRR